MHGVARTRSVTSHHIGSQSTSKAHGGVAAVAPPAAGYASHIFHVCVHMLETRDQGDNPDNDAEYHLRQIPHHQNTHHFHSPVLPRRRGRHFRWGRKRFTSEQTAARSSSPLTPRGSSRCVYVGVRLAFATDRVPRTSSYVQLNLGSRISVTLRCRV